MMKKREIQREEPIAEKTEVVVPTPVVERRLNTSITLPARVGILSIRVLPNCVIYNDGLHMNRASIEPGKPITITMEQ